VHLEPAAQVPVPVQVFPPHCEYFASVPPATGTAVVVTGLIAVEAEALTTRAAVVVASAVEVAIATAVLRVDADTGAWEDEGARGEVDETSGLFEPAPHIGTGV